MGSQEEEVHILMVTLPMQGHLNPILRFAKLLVSKGVHVTLATTEIAIRSSPNANISKFLSAINQDTNTSTAKTPRVNLEFFSDGLDDDFDRENNFGSFLESIQTNGSRNLSNLITNLTSQNKKPSCMISSPFTPWVVDVALKHDIPCAVLWIQACAVYSIYYRYYKNEHLFPSLDNPDDIVTLPAMPVLQVKELPSFILPLHRDVFKKLVAYFLQKLDNIKWVLANSFNELEEDVVASMASLSPIIPVGPLVSPFMLGKEETVAGNMDLWSTEDSCIEWLDKKPLSSVIYISFGSMILLRQQEMDSIAAALKNIDRPFLWVIKPLEKRTDNQFGELPSGFLEETKERGLVVKWCSQERVLMHPSVACFMTHCGWNSSLETVVAGVPVIAYPEWVDQPTDAKILVDVLKIGVKMRVNGGDGDISAEEVERCIVEVTDGMKAMKMKKRAVALKEAARKAVMDGGSSYQNIERFISEIKGISY